MDYINNEIDFDNMQFKVDKTVILQQIVDFINSNYNTSNVDTIDIANEILNHAYGHYHIVPVLKKYFPFIIKNNVYAYKIDRIIYKYDRKLNLDDKNCNAALQKKFPIMDNVFSWGCGAVSARGWRKFKGELRGDELYKVAQTCVDTYNQRANDNNMMVLEPVNSVASDGDKKAIVAITYRRQLYEFIFFSERGHTFLASLYCRDMPMSIDWPGHKLWIQTIYDLLGDRNLEIDDVYFKA